jgi:site-specific DNA-methyltransferase (adenine-specific)
MYRRRLVKVAGPASLEAVENRTINQDFLEVIDLLPRQTADLLFLDPPYNLTRTFDGAKFRRRSIDDYAAWLESWLPRIIPVMRPSASAYVCGDWRSSAAIQIVAGRYLKIRNRITWEREKGRGARTNWKNASEDIWFCTMSDRYLFNVASVKLKRRVIAPYTGPDGTPRDWHRAGNFRMTHPSNLWTDLSVPFWSMSENTDHPTQKPEKLLAKIILASTAPGDLVLDPFLGSGTTSVVAKKLGRRYIGIEQNQTYCCIAEKRLAMAETAPAIQGYRGGVFLERNWPAGVSRPDH